MDVGCPQGTIPTLLSALGWCRWCRHCACQPAQGACTLTLYPANPSAHRACPPPPHCPPPWRRCRTAFHLPCAVSAPNVMLEHEAFEVWCPHHADSDNSDEDYSLAAPRSRRTTGEHPGRASWPRRAGLWPPMGLFHNFRPAWCSGLRCHSPMAPVSCSTRQSMQHARLLPRLPCSHRRRRRQAAARHLRRAAPAHRLAEEG